MKRLASVEELTKIRDKISEKLSKQGKKIQVKVHLGTCGISSGANKTLESFQRGIESRKLSDVTVLKAACIGLCDREPVVTVVHPTKGKTTYYDLTEDKVSQIIEQHLVRDNVVEEWKLDPDDPLLKLQEIRIMHNQDLDPMNIEEYIARDGYQALAKALTKMKPEEVIEEVGRAALRGRGGAGFPTSTKWSFVRSAPGDEKYVVCNGDEGDPGAYMNRAVLEGNPHSIIEGMAIGAYAIGNVRQGYAYVRAEYPLAIETLNQAITQAREYGLLGENIIGTGFEFDLDIFPGAGAFVCGEETALLISIEGKRGNPRQRPPFPANKGLFGKPTTLNNVETWSNIPQIIWRGAEWFGSVGTERSRGTKTLCLVGKVNNTGLVEVPLGTSLGKIVFDIGGGIPKGKRYKAVQIGGPSGGVIPIEHLNTPVDYEAVTALGAIMGSGGLVVMDEDNCMVDVAKFFLQFTRDESCGKCTPCRAGIPKMLELLTKITDGKGTMEELAILEELAEMVGSASICGLGQTAPNPVLTTLRHFREEYEAHIIDKKCPAVVCQTLFKAPCQHTCPVGLDVPGYVALIKAGEFEKAYNLIMQRLPFPLSVGRVCHHPCEGKCRRGQIDEPIAIRHLKRAAADYAFEHGLEHIPQIKERRKEKVAIVGAGPAGLSAAWDLAREGYQITVFEALPVAGGMLAVGIPGYRLPKDMLNKESKSLGLI
ncbi:FAD-dependent oxidoreductase [Chloroflexota bacterium]